MRNVDALAMLALGGAIAADVVGTFTIERAARGGGRRLAAVAGAELLASIGLFALALARLPTAVAEALFVAIGSGAVAVIAARRGEAVTARTGAALGLLVAGVVVLQVGVGHG